jgi:hypothetical protein
MQFAVTRSNCCGRPNRSKLTRTTIWTSSTDVALSKPVAFNPKPNTRRASLPPHTVPTPNMTQLCKNKNMISHCLCMGFLWTLICASMQSPSLKRVQPTQTRREIAIALGSSCSWTSATHIMLVLFYRMMYLASVRTASASKRSAYGVGFDAHVALISQ